VCGCFFHCVFKHIATTFQALNTAGVLERVCAVNSSAVASQERAPAQSVQSRQYNNVQPAPFGTQTLRIKHRTNEHKLQRVARVARMAQNNIFARD